MGSRKSKLTTINCHKIPEYLGELVALRVTEKGRPYAITSSGVIYIIPENFS